MIKQTGQPWACTEDDNRNLAGGPLPGPPAVFFGRGQIQSSSSSGIVKPSTCARRAIAALRTPERPRERVALELMSDKSTLEIVTDTKPLIPDFEYPQRHLKRSCESKDHDGS